MDLANLLTGNWWILIGLAAGYILLLVLIWAVCVDAKRSDTKS